MSDKVNMDLILTTEKYSIYSSRVSDAIYIFDGKSYHGITLDLLYKWLIKF